MWVLRPIMWVLRPVENLWSRGFRVRGYYNVGPEAGPVEDHWSMSM